ncbi:hypothetical protein N7510_001449 [Penicillium lagena]|uniref:uncharacterized protein n=1 Tax=Penicillium lagena TaxID=94218 RepID=UPI00253FC75B|nr:uncharacterized protein N7510_001449 [Penicillium lagena]KAJ5625140.1 hypothetical protein N7510_001449 [Penicillium lagena]
MACKFYALASKPRPATCNEDIEQEQQRPESSHALGIDATRSLRPSRRALSDLALLTPKFLFLGFISSAPTSSSTLTLSSV